MTLSRGFIGVVGVCAGTLIGVLFAKTFTGWEAKAKSDVEQMVSEQEQAWNRGDLAAFLSYYAMDDSITFYCDDRVSTGWVALNERYRRRYSDAASMGKVAFTELNFMPLSAETVMVRGRWATTGTPNAGSGLFTILVRKTPNGWKIIHDHTSEKKNS